MKRSILSSPEGEIRFFASANSQNGFRNDFPVCFGEDRGLSVLYVLKGGPGTGKSHFLRSVSRSGKAAGYEVIQYLCSSDPTSLDGVLLTRGDERMGFLDGTSPHAWEPALPGAREELIHLGVFWDGERLRKRRQEIRLLDQEKTACYEEAYHYLHACGDVAAAMEERCAPFIKNEGILSLAKRILKQIPDGHGFQEIPAHLACVGMKGYGYLDTYEAMSRALGGEILYVNECYGLAYELTACLHAVSKQKGLFCLVSRHPIFSRRINALFYPQNGLCVTVGQKEAPEGSHRELLLQRYLKKDFRLARGELRQGIRLVDSLLEGGCQCLARAGEYHFALEQIYAEAMDFRAKDTYEKEFCQKKFKIT